MKNRLQRIRIGLIGCAVASLGLVNGQLFAQSGEKPTAGSAVKTMAKKMEGGSGAKKMDLSLIHI